MKSSCKGRRYPKRESISRSLALRGDKLATTRRPKSLIGCIFLRIEKIDKTCSVGKSGPSCQYCPICLVYCWLPIGSERSFTADKNRKLTRRVTLDLFKAIAQRHCYRGKFSESPVPRKDLVEIVKAGILAPSGMNEQVASFVIVDDLGLLRPIRAILDRPVCNTARAMIACVVDTRPTYQGVSFAVEDCAASVENMLLAITALGYASVWLDGVLRRDNVGERIAKLLKVPGGHVLRVLLPIGVPIESVTKKEKLPFEKRAWFNSFGG